MGPPEAEKLITVTYMEKENMVAIFYQHKF